MKVTAQGIVIDPHDISDKDYQIACRVLASSIRLALKDPEKRAEYEAWKREQRRNEGK